MGPRLPSWTRRRKGRNSFLPRPPPTTPRGQRVLCGTTTTIWRGRLTDIRGRHPFPRRRRTKDPIRTRTLHRRHRCHRRFPPRCPHLLISIIDVSIDHRQLHRRRWSPLSSSSNSSSNSIEVDVDLLPLRRIAIIEIIPLDMGGETAETDTGETDLPRWIAATKGDRNRTAQIILIILVPPIAVLDDRALLGLPCLLAMPAIMPARRIRPSRIPEFIEIIITIISKDAEPIADLLRNHQRQREEAIIIDLVMKANQVAGRCLTLPRLRRPLRQRRRRRSLHHPRSRQSLHQRRQRR